MSAQRFVLTAFVFAIACGDDVPTTPEGTATDSGADGTTETTPDSDAGQEDAPRPDAVEDGSPDQDPPVLTDADIVEALDGESDADLPAFDLLADVPPDQNPGFELPDGPSWPESCRPLEVVEPQDIAFAARSRQRDTGGADEPHHVPHRLRPIGGSVDGHSPAERIAPHDTFVAVAMYASAVDDTSARRIR